MNDVVYFFSSWDALGRVLVIGTVMYVSLVVLLRVSGSRTLASMNAFDFIVTVAIGAVFGRALTAKGVSLSEAVVALVLLVGLQYLVARLKVRWPRLQSVVTNPPHLLYFRGELLHDAMRSQRVSEDELRSAVRKRRLGSLADVDAIVLESSGDISVIGKLGEGTALNDTLREQIDKARH